ncbi:hypothetical protein TELCIR_10949 [Teladorsagia circumcincta]|uniref:Uncharacterized protein n=1 Tax=Teladorsagia circumcincta TaxID=45464 RepID=A0A2G9UAR6_TELCI|nr:hypothetical protein TELCIR_10949 [Teladorsagia circumcincta]
MLFVLYDNWGRPTPQNRPTGQLFKISFSLVVAEKRPEALPKQRWLDTLHKDLKTLDILPDQALNRGK